MTIKEERHIPKTKLFHRVCESESECLNHAGKKEKARQQLNTALKPILEKYMSENNISVVVDKKSIVVAKTEIDLTEKILKLLDKDLKSINLN